MIVLAFFFNDKYIDKFVSRHRNLFEFLFVPDYTKDLNVFFPLGVRKGIAPRFKVGGVVVWQFISEFRFETLFTLIEIFICFLLGGGST